MEIKTSSLTFKGGIPLTELKPSEGKCLMEVSSLRFSLYSVRRVEKSYKPEDFLYLVWTKIGKKKKVPALMIDQNEVCKHSSHIAVTHILAKRIILMFLWISSCHFSLLLIKLSLIFPQIGLSSDINWGIQQHRKSGLETGRKHHHTDYLRIIPREWRLFFFFHVDTLNSRHEQHEEP